MLKIVEIIGEDNVSDLDPETIYFINKILNDLNLKKIRNNILSRSSSSKSLKYFFYKNCNCLTTIIL